MPDDLPKLTVIEVGRPEARRFIIGDQFRRVWDGRRFQPNWAKARLYRNRIEAVAVSQNFVRQHYGHLPRASFLAPVIIKVWSDMPVSAHDLSKWCSRAGCLTLDSRAHGNGPDGSLVIPTIIWKSLRREKNHE